MGASPDRPAREAKRARRSPADVDPDGDPRRRRSAVRGGEDETPLAALARLWPPAEVNAGRRLAEPDEPRTGRELVDANPDRRPERARGLERTLTDTIDWYRELIDSGAFGGGRPSALSLAAAGMRVADRTGALGVLQTDGRYVLVDAAVLAEAEAIFPPSIALRVDPDAPATDDPYADPQYQVPDDLVW